MQRLRLHRGTLDFQRTGDAVKYIEKDRAASLPKTPFDQVR